MICGRTPYRPLWRCGGPHGSESRGELSRSRAERVRGGLRSAGAVLRRGDDVSPFLGSGPRRALELARSIHARHGRSARPADRPSRWRARGPAGGRCFGLGQSESLSARGPRGAANCPEDAPCDPASRPFPAAHLPPTPSGGVHGEVPPPG